MNERDEINLRLAQKNWQAKQDSSGTMTMMLCASAVGGFLYFVSAPSQQSVSVLAVCLVLLMVACARMIGSAAKVVEARNALVPAPIRVNVVDVEVVETQIHPTRRQLPEYVASRYSGSQF